MTTYDLETELNWHPMSILTDRQRDILRLVSTGKTNNSIAQILNISKRTVDVHIWHIREKLGIPAQRERSTGLRVVLALEYLKYTGELRSDFPK